MKHFTRALVLSCLASFSTINAGSSKECKDLNIGCKIQSTAFCPLIKSICPVTCGACEEIDYCENNNGNCTQICKNGDKEAICSCWDGYKLSEDNKDCEDINECEAKISKCEPTTVGRRW